MTTTRRILLVSGFTLAAILPPAECLAWGDEGHEIVGLIASHYLTPAVRSKVTALLATDKTGLTATDIEHEATWADRYRDSDRDTTKVHYEQTHRWHFVDIELKGPDLDAACSGHPASPPNDASGGPAVDCVVDKIDEFTAELKSTATPPAERRMALQFLLHFVGDVHQPLHASDDHDEGGNSKNVTAAGLKAGNLHHYWDTEFVAKLGADPVKVANTLVASITPAQRSAWQQGHAADWAKEAYAASVSKAYGGLPKPDASGTYALSPAYVKTATAVAAEQLSRAGVRLALVLNSALGTP